MIWNDVNGCCLQKNNENLEKTGSKILLTVRCVGKEDNLSILTTTLLYTIDPERPDVP